MSPWSSPMICNAKQVMWAARVIFQLLQLHHMILHIWWSMNRLQWGRIIQVSGSHLTSFLILQRYILALVLDKFLFFCALLVEHEFISHFFLWQEHPQGQQEGLSGYFPHYELPNSMSSLQLYGQYEISPSSSNSNFTEELERGEDLSRFGCMSPYSEHGNYMGFYGNDQMSYEG